MKVTVVAAYCFILKVQSIGYEISLVLPYNSAWYVSVSAVRVLKNDLFNPVFLPAEKVKSYWSSSVIAGNTI